MRDVSASPVMTNPRNTKTVVSGLWLVASGARSVVARYLPLAIVFLLATIHSPLATAQSETATIAGRVSDPSGAVLPKATLHLVNIDKGTETTAKTNNDGIYVIPAVQPGRYRIQVEHEGFKIANLVGLTINVQDNLEENFKLEVGSISESITVNGSGVNINTTDAAVSTVIDRQFVANMPLNGRSFQDLLTLAPGVANVGNLGNFGNAGPGNGGEITVNGQRTEANYFTVDGVSTNTGASFNLSVGAGYAGVVPGETALGTSQSVVAIDALQEFRATTSTYSAEYGRTPGGQFAFTTRSGTNDWHGSAYDYFRNEALDANNWFNNSGQFGNPPSPREKERQNDFGGTLGGPIRIPHVYNGKDKTFFFFSYEGLRLWTPQGLSTNFVPDATLRKAAPAALQPILNAFPVPNDGEDGLNDGFGLYRVGLSLPSSIDSVSVRVDHTFSDKLKIFGRFADTSSLTGVQSLATKTNNTIDVRTVTIGMTNSLTNQQNNEFRFNLTQNTNAQPAVSTSAGGAIPFNLTSLPGPNGAGIPTLGGTLDVCFCYGGSPQFFLGSLQAAQRQYNVTDSYSWTLGRHNLRFGFDWRRLATKATPFVASETVLYFSEPSVLANSADFAQASSQSPVPVEPVYKNFSSFVQDEWKVTPRLSLSLGLRWDVNPPPGNLTGPSPYTLDQITNLATAKLAPAGTPLWHTDWHAFAPRVGMAYHLSQASGHETVVRAGFGMFYDTGNAQGSGGFAGIGFFSQANFSGVTFPLTSSQMALPPASVAPPYNTFVYAFDPSLRLPYTMEWSLAVEQAFSGKEAVTLSYVGSGGRKLLAYDSYASETLGNPNFALGNGLEIVNNRGYSSYNALQVQYQKQMSHGLQMLASYTFSHSIDNASSNFESIQLLRSVSDFDIRHNFQAAVTYDLPGSYQSRVVSGILEHWGLDARISARSALPVNIIGTKHYLDGVSLQYFNPDVVPGQPLYLYGSQYAGGRIINYDAFLAAPAGAEGDAGRNSARGFGAWQGNLALRRDFPIHERLHLQFRAEAFNLFNHPNFGGFYNALFYGPYNPAGRFGFGATSNTLNNSLGGLNALYQIGGARSLQLMLKLQF